MQVIYEVDDSAIYPFIIAPVPSKQDTIIVCPKFLLANESNFISHTYKQLSPDTTNSIVAQVYKFEKYYCYCINFFHAEAVEIASKRKGLWLSVGALMEKNEFRNSNILNSHHRLLLQVFNHMTGHSLESGQGFEFLMRLQNDSNKTLLDQQLASFQSTISFNQSFVKKKTYYFEKIFNSFRRFFQFNSSVANIILCSSLYLDNDLRQIDLLFSHLNRTLKKVKKTYLSQDSKGGFTIKILPILPNIFNCKKLKLYRLRSGLNYITLKEITK